MMIASITITSVNITIVAAAAASVPTLDCPPGLPGEGAHTSISSTKFYNVSMFIADCLSFFNFKY